jgi:hypothetical protein
VAQLASADDTESALARAATTGDESVATTTPPTLAPTVAPPSDTPADQSGGDASSNGKIVIRIGDGDPIVLDLGDLGGLATGGDLGDLGDLGHLGDLGKIEECLGGSLFDIQPGDAPIPPLGGLNVFGDGTDVTVTGPDGLSVADFGDGDGSVTITKKDGQVTITTDGDVAVKDLEQVLSDLPSGVPGDASSDAPPPPSLPDFNQIYECLEGSAAGT